VAVKLLAGRAGEHWRFEQRLCFVSLVDAKGHGAGSEFDSADAGIPVPGGVATGMVFFPERNPREVRSIETIACSESVAMVVDDDGCVRMVRAGKQRGNESGAVPEERFCHVDLAAGGCRGIGPEELGVVAQ
jgi:hypothetical protein